MLEVKSEICYDEIAKEYICFLATSIRASKGFDRGLAAGEAIRCDTLIAKLKINAEDNLAYAA